MLISSPRSMSEKEAVDHVEGEEHDANYQPPPQKTIEEIMAADAEDESLRKYKEALLGEAQSEKIVFGKLFENKVECPGTNASFYRRLGPTEGYREKALSPGGWSGSHGTGPFRRCFQAEKECKNWTK